MLGLTLAGVSGLIFVFTSWRNASIAFVLLLVAAAGDPVSKSKPRRIDKRQERRLTEIREREARLKRERPADYPPAPWVDETPGAVGDR